MAKHKIQISKGQAKVQFVVGLCFIGLGLYMFSLFLMTPLPDFFMMFMVVWVGMAGYITYNAYRIGFKGEKVPLYEIETTENSASTQKADFEGRLRQLEALKSDGLLTENEYRAKRQDILKEKW